MLEPISVYYEEVFPNWLVRESQTNNHILMMITHGELIYTLNGKDYHLKKDDILYIPKSITRSATSIIPHKWYVIHFNYKGDGGELPILSNNEPVCISFHQSDYLRQRVSFLIQHWLKKPKYASTLYHSIILELLTMVNEEVDSGKNYDKAFVLVIQIQDYITQHYRENITIEQLAEMVDRSSNYVSSIFKKTTGMTISAYKQQIKISVACDLLTSSTMNIGEISNYLGFCEQSYFNKVFKKMTGTLPSTFLDENIIVWRSDN